MQGDIFSGLNDGLLSRAEALAAVDIGKHQNSHAHQQMASQLKHDVMYHHGMGGPPQRPLQVGHFEDLFAPKTVFKGFLNLEEEVLEFVTEMIETRRKSPFEFKIDTPSSSLITVIECKLELLIL